MKKAHLLLCLLALPVSMISACGTTPPADADLGGAGGDHSPSGGQSTGGLDGGASGGSGGGGAGAGDGGTAGGSGGLPATCGDGNVDDGEECDDGEDTEDCNANCTEADCGDGYANEAANEDCDEGEATATCNADCTEADCGNGVTDDVEGCDGDGEETADCNINCTESVCGDGITNGADGEACDTEGDSDECDEDCSSAACGDGYVNTEADEECDGELQNDEGDPLTADYCVECERNRCGDGVVFEAQLICAYPPFPCEDLDLPPYEDCDSGGIDTDDCNFDCTAADCGDGYWNAENFEDCDDGNSIDDDECSNACEVNPTP